MKKIYLTVLTVICAYSAFAQQDAQYTQYMYNTVGINPAYAGSREALSATILHRSQWVGLQGAPQTQSFTLHTPLKNRRLGLGLSFVNDVIGPSKEQYFNIDFSYTIPTSETGKLSFGLKGVANILSLNTDMLTPDVAANLDPNLNSFSVFKPNVGVGVYYHSEKLYLGVSAPNILETEHFDDATISFGKERVNFYLIGGYVFDLSADVKLKPAFLTKYVPGSPLQVDLSANVMLKEKFILGAAYRWSAAMSFMAGFQIDEQWMLGYGYDLDTTKLGDFNGGSHEVILRFELFNRKEKLVSPRFF